MADPCGELHDTKGVWIGDASAFPTPSGTNPMVTIMALATAPPTRSPRTPGPRPLTSRRGRSPLALSSRRAATPAVHRADPPRQLYIGGEWVEPPGPRPIEVIDSTTEQVIGRVPEGTPEDIDRAVAAARAGFEAWSAMPFEARSTRCRGRGLAGGPRRRDRRSDQRARSGCRSAQSRTIQAGPPRDGLRPMPAQIAREVAWEEQVGNSLVVREPIGVVGAITPWNYPLHQLCAKVAPALAAGCSVVAKPSEVTPLNAFVLAEILEEAGLPAGRLQPRHRLRPRGRRGDRALTMTSTWSPSPARPAPGKRVAEEAAKTVKRASLELGGKSANVILDDADLKQAVSYGMAKCFLNSGQTCSAHTRMLVPRSQARGGRGDRCGDGRVMAPGDPFQPGSRMGPLVSDAQRDRVRDYIAKGEEEGAKLVTGGAEPPDGLRQGYFVQPTVFSRGEPDMTIAQEEIFGPVLSIIPYDDEDEAVADRQRHDLRPRRRRLVRPTRAGEGVRAADADGQVQINGATFNPLAPFGGYKQSGHGRELGRFGLEEFLEVKSIQL